MRANEREHLTTIQLSFANAISCLHNFLCLLYQIMKFIHLMHCRCKGMHFNCYNTNSLTSVAAFDAS